MLQTNQVAQPLHCQTGKEKIPEFSCAVQSGRVIDNVIVNVFPIGMRCNDKSVFAFQKAGGQFVANLICFLCCDFAGSEGLPYLIGDDIAFLAAPGGLLVKKISVSGVLYEKGTIGTWQKVSSCSNSSTTSTCMVSSSFNTKPGKSYRLEYSATFSYSDGRSETITGSTSR